MSNSGYGVGVIYRVTFNDGNVVDVCFEGGSTPETHRFTYKGGTFIGYGWQKNMISIKVIGTKDNCPIDRLQ